MRLGFEQRGWGVPEHELQVLRDVWDQFQVDTLWSELKQRLEGLRIIYAKPSLVPAISIHKPRIVATLERLESMKIFNEERHQDEDITIFRRAYVLALNGDGFYTRYGENNPLFLERPERIRGFSDLRSLIDANIEYERGREPDWNIIFGNVPLPRRK